MAFEQVRIRLADGQEFGPVAWSAMLQWHQEGRVPQDAFLIDHLSGEVRPAAAFPELFPAATAPITQPLDPQQPYVTQAPIAPPTPPPGMYNAGPGYSQYAPNTPPDTTFSSALSYGYRAVMANMGAAILGFFVYALVSGAASGIPYIGIITGVFLMPPLLGGAIRYAMNFTNNNNPQISDLFTGFNEYGKWMTVYWVITGMYLLCMLPVIIAACITIIPLAISNKGEPDAAVFIVIGIAFIVSLIISLFVMPRYAFAYFLAADGYDAMEAIRTSARMAVNRTGEIIGNYFMFGLVGGLGVILCYVGMFFTMPISYAAMVCYYNAVKVQERIG